MSTSDDKLSDCRGKRDPDKNPDAVEPVCDILKVRADPQRSG